MRFQRYITCGGFEKVLRCPFAVEDIDHMWKMKDSSSSSSKNERAIKSSLRVITNPLKSNSKRILMLDRHYPNKLDFVTFPIILPPSHANPNSKKRKNTAFWSLKFCLRLLFRLNCTSNVVYWAEFLTFSDSKFLHAIE